MTPLHYFWFLFAALMTVNVLVCRRTARLVDLLLLKPEAGYRTPKTESRQQ